MSETTTSASAGPPAGNPIAQKIADVRAWWKKLTEVFDTNFLILIGSVYFLQGLGGFATFMQGYYLRTSYEESCPPCYYESGSNVCGDDVDLGVVCSEDGTTCSSGCHAGLFLSPGAQTALKATAGIPWNYKLFYGMMSDAIPIGGSNRRSYIALAGFFGTLGFIGLGLGGNMADPTTVTYLLLLTQLSTAFCDVCTDALVAANAKLESEEGAGNLQSLCWMSLGIGGMMSNIFAGYMFEAFHSTECWFLCAIIPASRIFLASRLKEPGPPGKVDLGLIKIQTRKIIKTVGHPGINRPIAFVFLAWATVPYVDMFNFAVDADSSGWVATKQDGSNYNTSEFAGLSELPATGFTCDWFRKNDVRLGFPPLSFCFHLLEGTFSPGLL